MHTASGSLESPTPASNPTCMKYYCENMKRILPAFESVYFKERCLLVGLQAEKFTVFTLNLNITRITFACKTNFLPNFISVQQVKFACKKFIATGKLASVFSDTN